jgi:geranylgeranyl pyrophosphate synthase
VEYSRRRLHEFVEQAVKALDVLEDSPAKAYLVELAHFTELREN